MWFLKMIKYFGIRELVPREVYNARGEKAWQLLDYRAIKTLEWLRENLGSCTVNDWPWGGTFSQSGLRTAEFYLQQSYTMATEANAKIAKSFSQHKYGRAFDCKFKNHTAEEARQWIKENWESSGFDWGITLEEGVSWLHFDTRNQPKNEVYTFWP